MNIHTRPSCPGQRWQRHRLAPVARVAPDETQLLGNRLGRGRSVRACPDGSDASENTPLLPSPLCRPCLLSMNPSRSHRFPGRAPPGSAYRKKTPHRPPHKAASPEFTEGSGERMNVVLGEQEARVHYTENLCETR